MSAPLPDRHSGSRPARWGGPWIAVVAVIAGMVAAAVVHVVLAPTSGVDTDPPVCWSYVGSEVPCGSSLWIGLAVGAGLVVGLVFMVVLRRLSRGARSG